MHPPLTTWWTEQEQKLIPMTWQCSFIKHSIAEKRLVWYSSRDAWIKNKHALNPSVAGSILPVMQMYKLWKSMEVHINNVFARGNFCSGNTSHIRLGNVFGTRSLGGNSYHGKCAWDMYLLEMVLGKLCHLQLIIWGYIREREIPSLHILQRRVLQHTVDLYTNNLA